MSSKWFVCVLLASLASAQSTTKPTPSPRPPSAVSVGNSDESAEQPAEPKVAATEAVITIKGTCDNPSKQGDACQTVITREQFEKLGEALRPNMTPNVRRQLATYYSRMLPMTKEAEKRGLDKQPKFEELIRFARMQILSQELSNTLQQDAQKVTDADIEKYYKENQPAYEEATLERIFIPRAKQMASQKPGTKPEDAEAQQKAAEEAMKKTAIDVLARAKNGEDFATLQKEAYAAAGIKTNPPNTKMEKVRQSTLPPTQKTVLELKAGEISDLISDPTGHYVYKLISKNTLPLDTAIKAEVKNTIASQRYRDAMQPYQQGNVDLNQAYFGPTRNPAAPPVKPGEQPTEGDTDPD